MKSISLMLGFRPTLRPKNPKQRMVTVEGLNYRLFKLFHLSIVWRAGVSSLKPFEYVRLGPHGERIREMLIGGNPGPWNRYPFWGIFTVDPQDHRIIDDLITEPTRSKIDGHVVYIFTYGGCTWHFFITSHRPTPKLIQIAFKESGSLTLGVQTLLENPIVSDVNARYTAQKAKLAGA